MKNRTTAHKTDIVYQVTKQVTEGDRQISYIWWLGNRKTLLSSFLCIEPQGKTKEHYIRNRDNFPLMGRKFSGKDMADMQCCKILICSLHTKQLQNVFNFAILSILAENLLCCTQMCLNQELFFITKLSCHSKLSSCFFVGFWLACLFVCFEAWSWEFWVVCAIQMLKLDYLKRYREGQFQLLL